MMASNKIFFNKTIKYNLIMAVKYKLSKVILSKYIIIKMKYIKNLMN